jgi:hypothetical protein
MAIPEPKSPLPLNDEEAADAFERLRRVTSVLLRVPKAELEEQLAKRRTASRQRPKPSP